MNILGINAYHGDSSAAIVVDGKLVAAIEEERFNRIKHWAGFPAESIRFCLDAAGLKVTDLDHVAVSFDPKANLGRKALFAVTHRPKLSSIIDRFGRQSKSLTHRAKLADACDVEEDAIKATIHNVEHHDAHIANGFFCSPFDEAGIVSIDGMGDFVSTVTAVGRGASYRKVREVFYPHSLGYLYNAITIYLGFPYYGDEFKVMGLAPYGKPTCLETFRDIIRLKGDAFELNLDYFTHPEQGISMSWENGIPHVDPFYSPLLEERLGPARGPDDPLTEKHEDIAASVQCVTEEVLFHLLNRLHHHQPQDNVVLVGGCAMNSVVVGKVTRETPYKSVFVPVGAADNGGSIGAAFHVWNRTLGKPRTFQLQHSYWGDDVDCQAARAAAIAAGLQPIELPRDQLLDHVVDAICAGKIVGWFHGRMEFGARALGGRSLLADPRRSDIRDIVNLKIKFREKFRPFAPSVLEEYAAEYFDPNEPSPFMERVLPIRPEKHAEIPAVTHVDGSGRLQTVSRETSPVYYELIERFRQRTGVPVLLNTSLNENEPIVRTPEEALSVFQRTTIDMLVLGDVVVER